MPNAESATADLRRLADALVGAEPLNWVITGDSITHGLVHTQGVRSYSEHLHEIIRGERERVRDVVVNTAISGHRISDILGDWDRRVESWRPDVVTLMIGTNDCTTQWLDPVIEVTAFAASITEVVRRVRDDGGIPVLQTPPTVDLHHAPDRARIGEFAQAVRDVAAREGVILVDQHAAFTAFSEGTGPGNDDMAWGLLDDAFHPNAAGHALLALGWADALGFDAASSPVRTDLAARVAVARHPQWPPA